MLDRCYLWLAWVLTISLSVCGSVYITTKPQVSIIKPASFPAGTVAQAAVATVVPDKVPATTAQPALPSGKLDNRVPILMYHSIAISDNSLCVSPMDLENQLNYLVQAGYHTITVKDMLAALQGKKVLPPKPVVITFDDGYRDNYLAAYPLLKQRGMVATIYIITEKVGTPGGITAAELEQMINDGIEIGSHTRHHYDLRSLNDQQLLDEIENSRDILAQMLHTPIETFCYPSGRYTPQIVTRVQQAGYQGAVTTHPGVMDETNNNLLIPRIRVSGGESLEQFIASLPLTPKKE